MNWIKINESYGYADWAADAFDRRMEREDEIDEITDSLDEDTVYERYIDYHEDIPEEEWIIDLWNDLYNHGLIEFYDYIYDGEQWLSEPSALIEIGDDCVYGELQELEQHPKWKARLEKYISEHPDYEMKEIHLNGANNFVIIQKNV